MGRPKLATVCSVNDHECVSGRIRKGYCRVHYNRVQRLGTTTTSEHSKKCVWCKAAFLTPQSKARFCSTICRDKERYYRDPNRRENRPRRPNKRPPTPKATVRCVECGVVVTEAHGNRRYCSDRCVRRVAERTRSDRRIYPRRRLAPDEQRDLREWTRLLQDDPCSYCGAPMDHLDHIDPIALGGSPTWDNLTAACAPCNRTKHASRLLAFLSTKAR